MDGRICIIVFKIVLNLKYQIKHCYSILLIAALTASKNLFAQDIFSKNLDQSYICAVIMNYRVASK